MMETNNNAAEIANFEINNFLNELGYCYDPENMDVDTTKYSRKGVLSIYVPNKDFFTTHEILGKFLSTTMYNQLIKFMNRNYWK